MTQPTRPESCHPASSDNEGLAGHGDEPSTARALDRDMDAEPDPDLQGEGNHTAARRYRKSVEDFVESGRVDPAAQDAEPDSEAEAREMRDAEAEGRRHARQ